MSKEIKKVENVEMVEKVKGDDKMKKVVDLVEPTKLEKDNRTHTRLVNAARGEIMGLLENLISSELGWEVDDGKLYGFSGNTMIVRVFDTDSTEFTFRVQVSGTGHATKSLTHQKVE